MTIFKKSLNLGPVAALQALSGTVFIAKKLILSYFIAK
jgi:hypothetical protein